MNISLQRAACPEVGRDALSACHADEGGQVVAAAVSINEARTHHDAPDPRGVCHFLLRLDARAHGCAEHFDQQWRHICRCRREDRGRQRQAHIFIEYVARRLAAIDDAKDRRAAGEDQGLARSLDSAKHGANRVPILRERFGAARQ